MSDGTAHTAAPPAEAASAADEEDLYQAQLDIFLDPHDPAVQRQAAADGVLQMNRYLDQIA